MKKIMRKLEKFLELGGIRKDLVFLMVSGIAVLCSLFRFRPSRCASATGCGSCPVKGFRWTA